MVKRLSKANTNSLGKPLTIYLNDAQRTKLERIKKRLQEKSPAGQFSLTAIIRLVIDRASEDLS